MAEGTLSRYLVNLMLNSLASPVIAGRCGIAGLQSLMSRSVTDADGVSSDASAGGRGCWRTRVSCMCPTP